MRCIASIRTLSLMGLLILTGLAGVLPAYAQSEFVLSKHEDLSTDDRAFDRTDILYAGIKADAIDFASLDANEWELKPASDGEGFKGSFENGFDGSYFAKIDLSETDPNVVEWTWEARIEDDKGDRFEAKVEIVIGADGDGTTQIEIVGPLEEITDDAIVVNGRTILLTDKTTFTSPEGQELGPADFSVGDEVAVLAESDATADNNTLATLWAILVIRLNDDHKEDVEVSGEIQEIDPDGLIVVQNLVFHITDETHILNENEETIGFDELAVGDVVKVLGNYTATGELVAVLIQVEDGERGSFVVEGVIESVTDDGIVVQNIFMLLTPNTIVIDPHGNIVDHSFLTEGSPVIVDAQIGEDGLPFAVAIKLTDFIVGFVIANGEIQEIFDAALVVQGRTFAVTNTTRFVDENGETITFGRLQVGEVVTVIGHVVEEKLVALLVSLGKFEQDDIELDGYITEIRDDGLVVQDVFFLVTEDTIILDENGHEIGYADLALGSFVEIAGIRASQLDMYYATRIKVETPKVVISGPIDVLGEQEMLVAGFHFLVFDDTKIIGIDGEELRFSSLVEGMIVHVEGALANIDPVSTIGGGDEIYVAEFIQVIDDPRERVVVTGNIEELGDERIIVENFSFLVTDHTVIIDQNGDQIRYDELMIGDVVTVVALVNANGVLEAQLIELQNDRPIRVSGRIEIVQDRHVVIAGVRFQVTEDTVIETHEGVAIEYEDLQVGMLARAWLYQTAAGELFASHMRVLARIENEVWVTGILEAKPEGNLVVLGRTFHVLFSTAMYDVQGNDTSYDVLQVGKPVQIRADLHPGGELVALTVQQIDETIDDIHVVGPVESIENGTIEVMGIYFFVTADTQVFDEDGATIPLESLTIGRTVELMGIGNPNGTRTAQVIWQRDVVVVAGNVTDLTDTSITVLDQTFSINTNTLVLGDANAILLREGLKEGQYVEIRGIQVDAAGKSGGSLVVTKVKVLDSAQINVSVEDPNGPDTGLPQQFALYQNYPNPFNPTTTIRFALNQPGTVQLTVYNLLGQEVQTLVSAEMPAGEHSVTWNGRDEWGQLVASGVYLYRIEAAGSSETRQMVFLK